MNHAVILAGGVGERFWPASTPDRPKQLLPLLSDRTMVRETADRLVGVIPAERWLVMTGARIAGRVAAVVAGSSLLPAFDSVDLAFMGIDSLQKLSRCLETHSLQRVGFTLGP